MEKVPIDVKLRQLVNIYAKKKYKNQEIDEHVTQKIHRFCLTLLNSRLNPILEENELVMKDLINKRLVRLKSDSNSSSKTTKEGLTNALRFSNLIDGIKKKRPGINLWPILYTLLNLSESKLNYRASNSSLTTLVTTNKSRVSSTQPNVVRNLTSLRRVEPSIESMQKERTEALKLGKPMSLDVRLPPNLIPQKRGREAAMVASAPDPSFTQESLLIVDLVYIFQGIDGQIIKFDENTNSCKINEVGKLSRSTLAMVHKLFELGFLFKRINNYIKVQRRRVKSLSLKPASDLIGDELNRADLVTQSFGAFLQTALSDYYRLIAVLDNRATHPDSTNKNGISEDSSQKLSLRRLIVWTLEPLQKFRILAVVIDSVGQMSGGAFLSAVHAFTNHGNPDVKGYVEFILKRISKPFFEMLRKWIYEGDLEDPYQEFFVSCDESVGADQVWHRKYRLRKDMVPSFLNLELAQKILLVGKSINFIRYTCQAPEWRLNPTITDHFPSFEYGNLSIHHQSIDKAYTATSTQLLELLFSRYRLMDHLEALKRYLLLGQGDFIQHMMDNLVTDLSKPATTLHRHNLNAILETSIRGSNAQFDDPELLHRLGVVIRPIMGNQKGWDVFSLDYQVDAPLDTVLTTGTMSQYLELFDFLWKLKRVEHTCSTMWRRQMSASKTLTRCEEINKDLHRSYAVTSEMIHVTYQYQYYLLFEVIECAWKDLVEVVNDKDGEGNLSGDLDRLIEAHDRYLSQVLTKGLLSSHKLDTERYKSLLRMFAAVLKYYEAHRDLINYGLNLAKQSPVPAKNILGKIRTLLPSTISQLIEPPTPTLNALPTTTTHSSSTTTPTSTIDRTLEGIRDRLNLYTTKFQIEVSNLVRFLAESSDQDLRSLCFRLNFNEVYSHSINTPNK